MHGYTAALILVASVVLSIVGTRIVHRHVPLQDAHNNVAGFIYSVIGVVYAVLLAFVVLVVWQQYDNAQSESGREAGIISDVYRDALVFPSPVDQQLRAGLERYVDAVEREWPLLAEGRGSDEARMALRGLWTTMAAYEPVTEAQKAWYAEVIRRLNDVAETRQARLNSSRSTLPTALWVVLIFGGIVTIGFAYLFGSLPERIHGTMIASLTAIIALIMVLIASLDRPFRGVTSIQPDPFEQLEPVFAIWRSQ